ncbi:MAG: hypothetical protein HQL73_01560 [Magnetococcales bacterium]|nr:hypothetical protein [Magnetococcales bacterium]
MIGSRGNAMKGLAALKQATALLARGQPVSEDRRPPTPPEGVSVGPLTMDGPESATSLSPVAASVNGPDDFNGFQVGGINLAHRGNIKKIPDPAELRVITEGKEGLAPQSSSPSESMGDAGVAAESPLTAPIHSGHGADAAPPLRPKPVRSEGWEVSPLNRFLKEKLSSGGLRHSPETIAAEGRVAPSVSNSQKQKEQPSNREPAAQGAVPSPKKTEDLIPARRAVLEGAESVAVTQASITRKSSALKATEAAGSLRHQPVEQAFVPPPEPLSLSVTDFETLAGVENKSNWLKVISSQGQRPRQVRGAHVGPNPREAETDSGQPRPNLRYRRAGHFKGVPFVHEQIAGPGLTIEKHGALANTPIAAREAKTMPADSSNTRSLPAVSTKPPSGSATQSLPARAAAAAKSKTNPFHLDSEAKVPVAGLRSYPTSGVPLAAQTNRQDPETKKHVIAREVKPTSVPSANLEAKSRSSASVNAHPIPVKAVVVPPPSGPRPRFANDSSSTKTAPAPPLPRTAVTPGPKSGGQREVSSLKPQAAVKHAPGTSSPDLAPSEAMASRPAGSVVVQKSQAQATAARPQEATRMVQKNSQTSGSRSLSGPAEDELSARRAPVNKGIAFKPAPSPSGGTGTVPPPAAAPPKDGQSKVVTADSQRGDDHRPPRSSMAGNVSASRAQEVSAPPSSVPLPPRKANTPAANPSIPTPSPQGKVRLAPATPVAEPMGNSTQSPLGRVNINAGVLKGQAAVANAAETPHVTSTRTRPTATKNTHFVVTIPAKENRLAGGTRAPVLDKVVKSTSRTANGSVSGTVAVGQLQPVSRRLARSEDFVPSGRGPDLGQVPVEGLGSGIANLLGDAVGGVVSLFTVSRTATIQVDARQSDLKSRAKMVSQHRPTPASESGLRRVGGGIRGILGGAAQITTGGIDILLGSLGTLGGLIGYTIGRTGTKSKS